jgi:F-type H+-transporting ATPase subunit epsilon
MPLTVTILTPDKALPAVQADHVTIPGAEGEAGIRVGHAPYVSLLKNGTVFIKSTSQANIIYAVRGGVAQVFQDKVTILTEGVMDPNQVSEADLLKRLQGILSATYEDPLDELKAKAEAQWIATELKVAGKQVPDLGKFA